MPIHGTKKVIISFVSFFFEKVKCVSPTMMFKCSGSSISALVLDYAILFVLVNFFGIFYLWASAVSFITAHSLEYYVNRNYIFKVKDTNIWRYVKFIILEILGLILLLASMKIMVGILEINYLWARGVSAVALGIFYFLMNTYYTFRN